jgi:hypothetical protein
MAFVKGKNGTVDTDKVYTPVEVAKLIISKFQPVGKVLDAFKGQGAFYNNYPDTVEKDWCEIDEGRDFFEYKEHVDWIITNPPYSLYDEVMEHSFEIADNIVYLVPLTKVVSSLGRIKDIADFGGVPYIYIIGASRCGFPFGFPACAIYIKRGYQGDTKIEVH